MAQRRMFSKKITETDIFLDMPSSTQCLYFHLNMAADDDGFVSNPKTIKRTVNASDDDLKLLIAKQFLITFESGIVVIRDWKIHNYIQSDRYIETIYKEEKSKLTEGKNKEYIAMYPECIQNVSTGKVSIELVKGSIELEKENTIVKTSFDYKSIIDKYHVICKSLPKVLKVSDKRKKLIKAIMKEYDMTILETAFFKTEQSDFLTGRSNAWKCNFDWLMNKNNLLKVVEGNYDNKKGTQNAMDRLREQGGYNEQTIL